MSFPPGTRPHSPGIQDSSPQKKRRENRRHRGRGKEEVGNLCFFGKKYLGSAKCQRQQNVNHVWRPTRRNPNSKEWGGREKKGGEKGKEKGFLHHIDKIIHFCSRLINPNILPCPYSVLTDMGKASLRMQFPATDPSLNMKE